MGRGEVVQRGWWSRHSVELLLAAVILVVVVPIVEPLMAQQASRYALTAALVDHRTVVIDRYADSLTVDRAERGGRLYSDKAPGQPVLAAPAYAAYRLAGGEPAETHRPWGNVGLWAVSTWSAALPAALLVVVMRRAARRVVVEQATAAALAVATATLLLPFATVLFSHVLTGLLLLSAYLLVRDANARPLAVAGAGFLAASAVAVEYSAALVGPVLLAIAVLHGGRRAGWFVAGAVLPGVALAAYHWVAFGGPLAFPYTYSHFATLDGVTVGVGLPDPVLLGRVLAGERGLLVLTPIVAVGVCGLVALSRDTQRRLDGVAGLVVLGLFLALMAGWDNPTGGASPGPRYVVPALPFLVFGVAEGFRRWPAAAWTATAVGWVTMGLATFTLPLAPRTEVAVLWWAERLVDGRVADVLGPGGGTTLAAAALAAAGLSVAALRVRRIS